MNDIKVPFQTLHVALAIGLFDLFLSEIFSSSLKYAWSCHTRTVLFRNGLLVIPRQNANPKCEDQPQSSSRRQTSFFSDPTKTTIFICQIILLTLCLWLELSISEQGVRTQQLVDERCYAFERKTKISSRHTPYTRHLRDPRIRQYLQDSKCMNKNTLLRETLAGKTALDRGYPQCCKATFQRIRNRDGIGYKNRIRDSLRLQGGGVGYVGDWLDGESFLAYSSSSVRRTDYGWGRVSGFATTSFWSWAFQSETNHAGLPYLDKSGLYWYTTNYSDRIVANVQLPRNIIRNAPTSYNATQRGYVFCKHRRERKCFDEHVRVAMLLHKQRQLYRNMSVKSGIMIRGTEANASRRPDMAPRLCVFGPGKVRFKINWVFITQMISDSNRNRAGPVATDLTVVVESSDMWCIDLSYNVSKMYFDATSRINLNQLPSWFEKRPSGKKQDNVSRKGTSVDGLKEMLTTAAVVNGLNPVGGMVYDCKVYRRVLGTSIGFIETAISAGYMSALIFVSFVSLFYSFRTRTASSFRDDPLGTQSLLEQLRIFQKAWTVESELHARKEKHSKCQRLRSDESADDDGECSLNSSAWSGRSVGCQRQFKMKNHLHPHFNNRYFEEHDDKYVIRYEEISEKLYAIYVH